MAKRILTAIGSTAEYASAITNSVMCDPCTSFRTLWQVISPTLRWHYDTLRTLTDAETALIVTHWRLSVCFIQEQHPTPYVSVRRSAVNAVVHVCAEDPPVPDDALALDVADGVGANEADWAAGFHPRMRPAARCCASKVQHRSSSVRSRLLETDGVLFLFPSGSRRSSPTGPRTISKAVFRCSTISPPDDNGEFDAFLSDRDPPVMLTAWSTLADQAAYTRRITDTLGAAVAPRMLLTPPDALHGVSRPIARRFLPMYILLSHYRSIAHHCAIRTGALACEARIVQALTPCSHDQLDNGQQVVANGSGARVGSLRRSAAIDRVLDESALTLHTEHTRALLAIVQNLCGAAAYFVEQFASLRGRLADRAGVAAASL
ncbi:glycosyl transferase family protein [Burkholderia gladioli]|uniref:Glycosyl transferase family protein n=1 Tax=Burkholderia gladioli (strain BSR3) TaxID=999541 RepID=F2LT33_BURGS|nr:glycosyl transferase family protein [Burkholderia gladioli]AEA65909.1 glycosyl transferase family protein [Burkholderia gladioli BSR3]MBW5286856.1 glycosyl transferase [Burkholderia gladioli]